MRAAVPRGGGLLGAAEDHELRVGGDDVAVAEEAAQAGVVAEVTVADDAEFPTRP